MDIYNTSYTTTRECKTVLQWLSLSLLCLFFSLSHAGAQGTPTTQVFAGEDTQICGDRVSMQHLGAYIQGAVSDGYWTTLGSGYFESTSTASEYFSVSSTYVPSDADYILGYFILRLTALDANTDDFIPPPFDDVRIDIVDIAPMVCRSGLNMTLDGSCQQRIDHTLLLVNPPYPEDHYRIDLFLSDGTPLDTNIVTGAHAGMTLDAKITLNCNGNSCWGQIAIEDKSPPTLYCQDLTVTCLDNILPDSVGFPAIIPPGEAALYLGEGNYSILGIDNCTETNLSYNDTSTDAQCQNGAVAVVHRMWAAEDQHNNESECGQTITVVSPELVDFEMPPHFVGDSLPVFLCTDVFPLTDMGHPSPDTTGYPMISSCNNVQAKYNDFVFPVCGSGYNLLREWTIVDWCTSATIVYKQNISIIDSTPPLIACPDDVTIGTATYDCGSDSHILQLQEIIDLCSDFTIELEVRDTFDNRSFGMFSSEDNEVIEVEALSLGIYRGHLVAVDECNNADSCSFLLTIKDNTPPVVVCDQNTEVGLLDDGTARLNAFSLDDGSIDNCGIDRFEMLKLTTTCDTLSEFSHSVDFCCDDLGIDHDVVLRVWDYAGNFNDCSVIVRVIDSQPPKLYCPSDVTIQCDTPVDIEDLSSFGLIRDNVEQVDSLFIWNGSDSIFIGLDGLLIDNCYYGVDIMEEVGSDISCSTGSIQRVFSLVQPNGQTRQCTQHIYIENDEVFNEANIIWPPRVILNTCNLDSVSDSIFTEPTFINDECGMLASSYKDLQTNTSDQLCYSILREWSVIDWCQYDDEGNGLWTHIQEVRVENTVGPTFSEVCDDVTVCVYDSNCSQRADLHMAAIDDCTADVDLFWLWVIDYNRDGNSDLAGVSSDFDEELAIGNHSMVWKVEDGCGNTSTCEQIISVQDCKAPTIFCHDELVTTYMESDGTAMVNADQFDLGSADNCSDPSELQFSFSRDINDVRREFHCEDIPSGVSHIYTLEIWVTDPAGNQDYCEVSLHVYDSSDYCQDTEVSAASIQGNVYTPVFDYVSQGSLELRSISSNKIAYYDLDVDGHYLFDALPLVEEYTLGYESDASIIDGLSVLDLVATQNHVLRLREFDNPYQYYAADVNGSQSVSATDLVMMRKVILGIVDEFPVGKTWIEMPADQSTDDIWDMETSAHVSQLMGHLDMDLVLVKLGDVNFSNSAFSQSAEPRSSGKKEDVSLVYSTTNHSISFEDEIQVNGFQFRLTFSGNHLASLEDIVPLQESLRPAHINFTYDSQAHETHLHLCWLSEDGSLESANQLLQLPNIIDPLQITSVVAQGLHVTDDEYGIIDNIIIDDNESLDVNIFPNPVIDTDLTIALTGVSDNVELTVLNQKGQEVYSSKHQLSHLNFELIVPHLFYSQPGLYFIKCKVGDEVKILPFISI